MAKTIVLNGVTLYEQPESGSITNGMREFVYACVAGQGVTAYRALGALNDAEQPIPGITDSAGSYYYVDYSGSRLVTAAGYDKLYISASITMIPAAVNPLEFANGHREYSLSCSNDEPALECHKNYLFCWNHQLLTDDDSITEAPAWWSVAKTFEGGSEHYRVCKPDDPLPEGWRVIGQNTKPGVEAFRRSIATVTERAYFKSKSRAIAAMAGDNVPLAPGETYGRKTGNQYWLASPVSTEYDGYNWVAVNSYLYNENGWDSEIYPPETTDEEE